MNKKIHLRLNVSGNKLKNNVFDYLLILYITLLILGVLGGSLEPIRVFVILCAPFTLYHFLKNKKEVYHYQYEFFLYVIWILYGIVTLLWAIIPKESIKEILYLVLNFFAFLTIIYFANKANKPQDSVLKGWLLLFLLTMPIALCELWFDVHLPISVQTKGMVLRYGNLILNRRFASVTYGNLNGYNTLLCYMLPFILGYSVILLNKIKIFFIWLIILCLSYIIVINGSRGASIGLLLGFMVYIFYFLKRKTILVILTIVFIVAIYMFIKYYDAIFALITKRFAIQGLSDPGRSKLLASGWRAFLNSGMLGIGAGNFMPTMNSVYKLKITASHNLFLEVGVQYGIIIFILFLGLLVRLFLKQNANQDRSLKFIVIASLVMFPVTSIIDSGYIRSISVWLFLASLYIIADKRYNIN